MNQKRTASTVKIISGGIGDYPMKLELIPKRLVVSIYQQRLMGKGSLIPCWIFVTQGMAAQKQKEFVLVLRLQKGDNGKTFPKAPLQLFIFLYKAVLQKKRFNVGDVTRLGEKGFMGFKGVGYTFELVNAADLNLPEHYLTCILLSTDETMAAQASGLTRVLARLGYEINWFPIHPWNELERNSLRMQTVLKESQFRDLNAISVKRSSVNLVGGDRVVLVLAVGVHAQVTDFIKSNAAQPRMGFITQLLPYHEGALVWLPDKDLTEMNLQPDAEGQLIAGSFLIMSRAEHNGATMLEEGFHAQFDEESWQAFGHAILRKQNLTIPANGGDMDFSLVWNTTADPEKMPGVNIQSGLGEESAADSNAQNGKFLHKIKRLFGRR
ncbi:MAG: hypothetical protein PVF34_06460 [Gammaproteobacteria bacterium]|jgi:hypothetical protein